MPTTSPGTAISYPCNPYLSGRDFSATKSDPFSVMGPKARTLQDIPLPDKCSHLAGHFPMPRWLRETKALGLWKGATAPCPAHLGLSSPTSQFLRLSPRGSVEPRFLSVSGELGVATVGLK